MVKEDRVWWTAAGSEQYDNVEVFFYFSIFIFKNVWKSDKSWEPERIWKFKKNWKFENLKKNWKFEKIWKFENLKFKIAQVDPQDMLNNFCFHV